MAKNINNSVHVIFKSSISICSFHAKKKNATQTFLTHCGTKVRLHSS